MGNHDSWCFCTHDPFVKCESCLEDERTEEIRRQQKAKEDEWAKKRRMDQFLDDLNDPDFRREICKKLGIQGGEQLTKFIVG